MKTELRMALSMKVILRMTASKRMYMTTIKIPGVSDILFPIYFKDLYAFILHLAKIEIEGHDLIPFNGENGSHHNFNNHSNFCAFSET